MPPHLSQLFQSLLEEDRRYQRSPWRPPADIYRAQGGWLVKLDLAGVRSEDVELGVNGRCLTVQGIRRDHMCGAGHQAYTLEIAYNRFQREIQFPCNIERTEIRTEYHDGMLLVRLRMLEEGE